MNKTLVFDMDGTITNLYEVNNWLEKLRAEDATPYKVAKPMYDMDSLTIIINMLKDIGWKIAVTSWLVMDSSKEYDEKVTKAKIAWLKKYNFPFDEVHIVAYGTLKDECTRKNGGFQILVDDNEEVRNNWTLGDTINAKENIMEKLADLLMQEVA